MKEWKGIQAESENSTMKITVVYLGIGTVSYRDFLVRCKAVFSKFHHQGMTDRLGSALGSLSLLLTNAVPFLLLVTS